MRSTRCIWAVALTLAALTGCGGGDVANSDDADGDTITNGDEGASNQANTDGDGWADYLDYDSDADGILDALEAGDADLGTPPVDSDGDGVPDFRDTDSDDDQISDTDELDSSFELVDTDTDGIFDYLDDDSDADTILDLHDGGGDKNGNGTPNFRDHDSDGDGIPDAIEAGDADLQTPPVDTDQDMVPDFLDLDSDNDYLLDSEEDKNGNGIVDPGESSPTNPDTDGDGTPDLVEVIAGSDPNDPTETIPPGDFYFVLPYQGPGASGDLDFTTTVQQADVFFSMDTTGSFGEEIQAVQDTLEQTIVPGIAAVVPDAGFGVGRFEDFPYDVGPQNGCCHFGLAGDKPYELLQPMTTVIPTVVAGLSMLPPAAGGLDPKEAGFEALYQWASGTGIPDIGYPPFAPPGIGGVGFRQDSLPIIVHITDVQAHAAADYQSVFPSAHGRDDAVAALNAIGARVIGIDSQEHAGDPALDPRLQMEDLAIATKAVIPPDQNTGKCHMGVGGAQLDPVTVNNQPACPVVFDVLPDGTGLGSLIVDAVAQLAQLGVLDISTKTVGQPEGLKGEVITPGYDTADFIKAVTPVPPPPQGSTIQGDVFLNVTPGSTVTFKVDGFNDFQPSTEVDQLFAADIDVLGDLVTVLDVRTVYIIVPKQASPVPQ